ncbi:hypothetical protein DFH06DRAFT_283911 [Mycena polygramma]|nr:hypothetical protein DFH06DRAFT_283911 [Mycena polygramma]
MLERSVLVARRFRVALAPWTKWEAPEPEPASVRIVSSYVGAVAQCHRGVKVEAHGLGGLKPHRYVYTRTRSRCSRTASASQGFFTPRRDFSSAATVGTAARSAAWWELLPSPPRRLRTPNASQSLFTPATTPRSAALLAAGVGTAARTAAAAGAALDEHISVTVLPCYSIVQHVSILPSTYFTIPIPSQPHSTYYYPHFVRISVIFGRISVFHIHHLPVALQAFLLALTTSTWPTSAYILFFSPSDPPLYTYVSSTILLLRVLTHSHPPLFASGPMHPTLCPL